MKKLIGRRNAQSGMSILEVIVSLGITLIVGLGFISLWKNELNMRKSRLASASVQEVSADLQRVVWNQVAAFATAGCGSAALGGKPISDYFLDQEVLISSTQKAVYLQSSPKLLASASDVHNEAAKRCGATQLSGNDVHFCLSLDSLGGAQADSGDQFSASSYAFVEIRAQLLDLVTNQPFVCPWPVGSANTFDQTKTIGARIDYAIYWSKAVMSEQKSMTKSGSFIAAR